MSNGPSRATTAPQSIPPLATLNAANAELARLRAMFTTFEDGQLPATLDEYSEVNIQFHQTIITCSPICG